MAAPSLLKRLDLTGVVVTGDAMQPQRALSRQIGDAQGDGCWLVKENQPDLLASLELLFERPRLAAGWSDPTTDVTTARQVEQGHGRLETRIITVSRMRHEYVDWPYLDQVVRLERRITTSAGITVEAPDCYGITSLPPSATSAPRLLTIVRTAWGIENGLHYRRDVTLYEDACQVRRRWAPRALAALNNTVIGLALQTGARNLSAEKRDHGIGGRTVGVLQHAQGMRDGGCHQR